MKTYLATKAQLDQNSRTLSEINTKIEGIDLTEVVVAVLDFQYDDVTIISGGYNSTQRIIST